MPADHDHENLLVRLNCKCQSCRPRKDVMPVLDGTTVNLGRRILRDDVPQSPAGQNNGFMKVQGYRTCHDCRAVFKREGHLQGQGARTEERCDRCSLKDWGKEMADEYRVVCLMMNGAEA